MERLLTDTRNLLFDLGGVIIDLDQARCIAALTALGDTHAKEMLQLYAQQGEFMKLEEGAMSATEFLDYMRRRIGRKASDKEIIDAELQLKDLETVESRITKVQKQAQTGGDKQAKQVYEVLLQYKEALEQGKSARTVTFESKEEQKIAHDLFLLTSKPVLYVCNVDEQSAVTGNSYVDAVREAVKDENAEILVVAAKIESEIAEFDNYEERQMFLQEIGLEESGVNRLIKSAYKLLNLETFLTAGEQEVRAWTYRKGWKAPQCAGVIHTDFEKGFIRAEVIKYADYIAYGSETAVKEAGKMSVEGKEYVVQDGDIMHFRFNV